MNAARHVGRYQGAQILVLDDALALDEARDIAAESEREILQLVVRGSDHYTEALLSRHADTHNQGQHVLHCGGDHDSHLLIPVAGAA